MNNYALEQNHIKLISVNKRTTIFFNTFSLQIYPLEDKVLINFLKEFKQWGYIKTKEKYSEESFNEIYDFILNKIENAPKTVKYNLQNTDVNNFASVILPIAANCNLKCSYCFAQTDNNFRFKNYDKQDVEKIINFVMNSFENKEQPVNFVFFGGEPFLNIEVIKHSIQYVKCNFSNRKIGYSVTTNATIINNEIINIIKENNIAVLLSVDGPDDEYNVRLFKNGKKSINKVLENIVILKKNNIFPEIRATFTSNNPHLIKTVDFFEQMQLKFNIAFAYVSENKLHNLANYNDKNLIHIENELNELLIYYEKKICNKEVIFNKWIENINKFRFRVKQHLVCSAGLSFYTITADGTIFSCAHFMNDKKFAIGNILEGVIDKTDFIPIDIDNITDCSNCWVKYLCSGGCVSQKISAGLSNKSANSKNECKLEKLRWKFLLKLYYKILIINPKYFENES
ncbi:MAG: radical SAM protein [Bacteroidales bacterium]|jgi:radical SAM protein with 4Fe4S-binding SPASM domain|nr:radical SAM protein [Bacteroidales bacterium]